MTTYEVYTEFCGTKVFETTKLLEAITYCQTNAKVGAPLTLIERNGKATTYYKTYWKW